MPLAGAPPALHRSAVIACDFQFGSLRPPNTRQSLAVPLRPRLHPWVVALGWLILVLGLTALSGWLVGEDNRILGVLVYLPAIALVWWPRHRVRRVERDERPPNG